MLRYDYVDSNKKFVNPYNFVTVPSGVKRDLDATADMAQEKTTGYFECSLVAKTPLAIPDIKDMEKDRYAAFSINGQYAIPAGSLRGVIRSAYETVTNSCMVTIKGGERITKRYKRGFAPCILKKEKDGWKLYAATRVPIVTNDNKRIEGKYKRYDVQFDSKYKENCLIDGETKYYYGNRVFIKSEGPGHKKFVGGSEREVWKGKSVSQISSQPGQGMQEGYLFLGEKIYNKHAESVFINPTETTYSASEVKAALDGLEITLDMYNNDSVNRNLKDKKTPHLGYPGYKRAKGSGIIPLWFKYDHGHLYLSLAAIGRMAYFSDMKALTKEHNRCSDRRNLCPACAMFGMVAGSGTEDKGLGSKVRFTEGLAQKVEVTDDYVVCKELGTPKPSYLEFYSKNGSDYDAEGTTIRGRKYYWHIPKAAEDDSIYRTDVKTDRNSAIQLIKPGSTFKFKVFYEDLTSEQIQMLAWAITLGGNDSNNMHKIGHAKPYGLGSVKVTIDKNVVRQFDIESGAYSICEVTTEFATVNTNEIFIKEFLKITDFNAIDADLEVRYPYVYPSESLGGKVKDNDVASHRWFSENNNAGKRVLPNISVASSQPFVAKEVRAQGNVGNASRSQSRINNAGT